MKFKNSKPIKIDLKDVIKYVGHSPKTKKAFRQINTIKM